MTLNDGALVRAMDTIEDADHAETAQLVVAALRRLGEHGRQTAEAILGQVRAEGEPDSLLVEGLAQIEAVDGVISGRTDSL